MVAAHAGPMRREIDGLERHRRALRRGPLVRSRPLRGGGRRARDHRQVGSTRRRLPRWSTPARIGRTDAHGAAEREAAGFGRRRSEAARCQAAWASPTAVTRAASSCGSAEKPASGPPSDRCMVRCFSTMVAPSATAATADGRPEGVVRETDLRAPHRSRIAGIARRSMASGGAGYAELHRSSATSGAPLSRAALTAASISSTVAMPVDIRSGLPLAAAYLINGRSTSSNDAILNAGTSRSSRKSTASRRTGTTSHRARRRRRRDEVGRPLPWCLRLGVEVGERPSVPERAPRTVNSGRSHRTVSVSGGVVLELDRVGAGLGGPRRPARVRRPGSPRWLAEISAMTSGAAVPSSRAVPIRE